MYIYLTINKINGKKYIGQTINPQLRYNAHKSNYKNPNHIEYNSLIHKAFRKYGFNNQFTNVLKSFEDCSDIIENPIPDDSTVDLEG